jgi:hypothetical protein
MQKLEDKTAVDKLNELKEKIAKEPVPVLPPKPIQLMVGIPVQDKADIEWCLSYGSKLLTQMVPPNTLVLPENRYGIGYSRESIINNFISNSAATHLLFFDTDILPVETHGIKTLLDDTIIDPSKYIVSGIYYNSLYSGLAAWKNEVALKYQDIKNNADPLLEVDKIGMGYCVIRKELFHILNMEPRPLFNYKIMEGNLMESEDFTFLKMLAAKYGIKPYIDTRVTAQHIKRCKVNIDGGVQF